MAQENQRCDGSQLQDGSADELEGQSRGLSLKRGCRPSHSPKHHAGGQDPPCFQLPTPSAEADATSPDSGQEAAGSGLCPHAAGPTQPGTKGHALKCHIGQRSLRP